MDRDGSKGQQPVGLTVVHKRRRDGTTVSYFYDRRTKTFLGHDRAVALGRLAELREGAPRRPQDGTLEALAVSYLSSAEFSRLKPRTQALYRLYLGQIRAVHGDSPVRSIRASMIQEIKERLSHSPSKANLTLTLFRILLGRAVKLDLIRENPALRPGRIPVQPRRQVWSRDDEDAFLAAAAEEGSRAGGLTLAFLLLLYTTQRLSDVLAMTKGQVTEREGRLFVRLRQQKTDELIDVPVHRRLEERLRDRLEAVEGGLLLVASPTGRPWRRRNFSRAWDVVIRRLALRDARALFRAGLSKEAVRAELAARHRQRRDLRRTGVVRLAEAGATIAQIAAITGWQIDYCQSIVDTYLPRRTEVALGGVVAWEEHAAAPKIVRLRKP